MNTRTDKVFLRYSDLQDRGFGSRTKIWKMVKNFKFPAPVDDGNGNPVWLPEHIETFLASRPRYDMKEPDQLKKWREENHYATT